ncbi:hypothetical protein BASA83_003995 [Batrachochytrium salamandrivorans]|nr:hypothetical protein BASA83_003995 [Batrachochytrium salamandrivorans]
MFKIPSKLQSPARRSLSVSALLKESIGIRSVALYYSLAQQYETAGSVYDNAFCWQSAVSGNTIPSTDSYNVQQLEKRGNNDPASKKSASKNPMAKLMAKYEAPKQARYNVFTQHSMMVDEQEKLDEQGAQS